MAMEVKKEEKDVICRALGVYLSDLRQEIVKTEKYEMRMDMHREKDVIRNFLSRCRSASESEFDRKVS